MYCTVLTYGPEDVDNDHGDLNHVPAATLHLNFQRGRLLSEKNKKQNYL